MSDPLELKMAELRDRFVAQAAERRAEVRDALDRGNWADLTSTAHKLAGNAGMFGFADIGQAALEIEECLDTGGDPHEPAERLLMLLDAL